MNIKRALELADACESKSEFAEALRFLAKQMREKPASPHRQAAAKILVMLNEKTGRRFPPVDANLRVIEARMKEGFTEQQLRSVIAKKVRDWKGTDRAMYLRPKTLFNATNFANYAGELCNVQNVQPPLLDSQPSASADGDRLERLRQRSINTLSQLMQHASGL
jgi:uncharacterized phage protein (TIGR02220 family)